MVAGPDFFQSPTPEHFDEIDKLLVSAFEGGAERSLVRALRANDEMWHEMMLTWEGEIVAYGALSKMRQPIGWACFAPLAVLPRYQNHKLWRLGSLVASYVSEVAHISAERKNPKLDAPETVVVLGKVSFYERVGFSSTRARRLTSPYPLEHTLIVRPGDDIPQETLIYPAAFENLPS